MSQAKVDRNKEQKRNVKKSSVQSVSYTVDTSALDDYIASLEDV